MTRFVIDASVAIKWIIEEGDSDIAVAIMERCPLSAPDLLVAECSNILWKKVRRGELTQEHALLGARVLQGSTVELLPTRHLIEDAIRLAIDLDHPAYDCVYLALAVANDWPFVTADTRLIRRVRQVAEPPVAGKVVSMAGALERQAAQQHD